MRGIFGRREFLQDSKQSYNNSAGFERAPATFQSLHLIADTLELWNSFLRKELTT